MLGRIIEQLWLLSGYFAQTAAAALLLGGVYLISLRRFRFDGMLIRVHGLFAALTRRRMLSLSTLYLRLSFILWCLAGMRFDRLIYAVLMLAFCALLCALDPAPKHLFAECANTVLLLAGLYAAGLLAAYMREIQFDWGIFTVYVLLAVFMTLYALYFFFRDVKLISEARLRTAETAAKAEHGAKQAERGKKAERVRA